MAVPNVCLACWLEIAALEESVACARHVSGLEFTGWRRKLLLQVFELTPWTLYWDSCGISLWPVLLSLVLGNLCWESGARQGATAWINAHKPVWAVCQNPALWDTDPPKVRLWFRQWALLAFVWTEAAQRLCRTRHMTALRGTRAGTPGCQFRHISKWVSAVYTYTPICLLMI